MLPEVLQQLRPTRAEPVDPRSEAAVRPSEMTELVRQHGLELLGRDSIQQRKADGQVIPRPSEDTEPRDLSDAGVEAAVEDDIVRSRRPKLPT